MSFKSFSICDCSGCIVDYVYTYGISLYISGAEWNDEGPVDSTVVITMARNGRNEAHSLVAEKEREGMRTKEASFTASLWKML